MRTTLTLDEDVARHIERLREQGATLKDVVNRALRLGLREMEGDTRAQDRFETNVVSLGRPTFPDVDNVAETLADAEGDAWR